MCFFCSFYFFFFYMDIDVPGDAFPNENLEEGRQKSSRNSWEKLDIKSTKV